MIQEVYIVSAVRTPLGSFGGSLSTLTAPQLGAITIKEALKRANVQPETVQEVLMGNVLTANVGQAPARQAALFAGLPPEVTCTTINKVCASGAKAITLAAQSIMLGITNVVVAGGMESMSNVPYYLDKARFGYKLGHGSLIDGLIKDGLWDVYNDFHMGNAAELTAKEMGITREKQDEYTITSYKRAAESTHQGAFKNEIIPVELQGKGGTITVTDDEEVQKVNFEKIPQLKPVFQKEGTVTAANASSLNDGASALILASGEKVKQLGLKPMAKIIGFADAEQAPEWFTTCPAIAIPKALNMAGISKKDVDFFEINEAFAVVAIANNEKLELSPDQVNVRGGAVALGHPIGCSGARIVTSLVHILEQKNGHTGVAGICNGGGGATAIVVQKV